MGRTRVDGGALAFVTDAKETLSSHCRRIDWPSRKRLPRPGTAIGSSIAELLFLLPPESATWPDGCSKKTRPTWLLMPVHDAGTSELIAAAANQVNRPLIGSWNKWVNSSADWCRASSRGAF